MDSKLDKEGNNYITVMMDSEEVLKLMDWRSQKN